MDSRRAAALRYSFSSKGTMAGTFSKYLQCTHVYSSMQYWYSGHFVGRCTYKENNVMPCALNTAGQGKHRPKCNFHRLISVLSWTVINAVKCTCPLLQTCKTLSWVLWNHTGIATYLQLAVNIPSLQQLLQESPELADTNTRPLSLLQAAVQAVLQLSHIALLPLCHCLPEVVIAAEDGIFGIPHPPRWH